ncbi:MAG: hypothetical protein N2512_12385, partial [Armatimonadetes bacterium]|nr:hypothetical protein [Armatimonadota bacterium]
RAVVFVPGEVREPVHVLLLCVCLQAFAAESEHNLLANPGFENQASGWAFWGTGPPGVTFEAVKGGRSGDWAASIRVEPSAPVDWYQWQQTVTPRPLGRTYRLWGWVRTENVRGASGVCISLRANDAEGRRIAFADTQRVSGTHSWTLVWTELTLPEGTASLGVGFTLHGYGRAFFDDLVLQEKPQENPEQVRRLWAEMGHRGEWVLAAMSLPPLYDALPLTADQRWSEVRPYGWEQAPQAQVLPDGLFLDIPVGEERSATLRLDLPAGRYRLWLWVGGSCGARIPLDVQVNGRVVARRLFPLSAELLSFPVETAGDIVRITFSSACRPLPFGPSAAAAPIKALSLAREGAESAVLAGVVQAWEDVREAAVSAVASQVPDVPRPGLTALFAGDISPEELSRLPRRDVLELIGTPGDTVSGGALLMAEPHATFSVNLEGGRDAPWLKLLVGVPGWARVSGMQRWDFWHSPARWFEEASRGRCSAEGLGVVWLRARIPAGARPAVYRATLAVRVGQKVLRLPVRVRVLPLRLPRPAADLGMFYNATLNLSCPDDELYHRWAAHFADMRDSGMNCVFVYTFRMLWHRQTEEGFQWQDEGLREFLRLYSRFFSGPLYLCTHGDRYHPQGYTAYCRHVQQLARAEGLEVLFMPVDEAYASEDALRVAEEQVRMVKEAGARVAMTTDHTEAERLDPWLDVRVYGGGGINRSVIEHTRAMGDVLAIYNGGSTGDPVPAADRFFYGVYAWATGAEGVFQWAYQWPEGDPLDDRDSSTRDWCYTIPAGSSYCAPSPQWEAVAEGITDMRYLLAAEDAVRRSAPNSAKLRTLIDEVRAEVAHFLDTNPYVRYAEGVANPPPVHPYAELQRKFSYGRLCELRRRLQVALLEAGR